MEAIDFYKFITNKNIEYNWFTNESNEKDVYFCINIWHIDDFYNLLTASIFDDDGIECTMKDGYFVFTASHILDRYGIELTDIFAKENE